ncbi:MAG: LamG-like jellyroll fold domain-containing protein [Candidatus Paceibacterota bacterium]
MYKIIFKNIKIQTKAFTLIELMVVVAIIAILSMFAINAITNSKAKELADLNKARMISAQWKNSLAENMISEWKFDEASGNTVYNSTDYGTQLDGTLSGSPTRKLAIDCVFSACVELDGTDDFITIADSNSVLPPADSTVALWAYNGVGAKSYPTFYNRHNQIATAGFWWVYTSGTNEVNIVWQYANGTIYTTVSWTNVFPANKWSYLVFVYDNIAKTITLYVDGVAQTPQSIAGALPVTSGTLYIGSYGGATASYAFTGKIDEFQTFDKVLSVSIIKDKYFAGLNNLLAKNEITIADYSEKLAGLQNETAAAK